LDTFRKETDVFFLPWPLRLVCFNTLIRTRDPLPTPHFYSGYALDCNHVRLTCTFSMLLTKAT